MSDIITITRRDFLRKTGVGTGALVLGCHISPKRLFAENSFHDNVPLDNFVTIEPMHGTVIIMANRSEMGQGIRSSLAAVLADELEADWKRVVVRQADADAHRYGVQNPIPIPGLEPEYIVPGESAQLTESSRSMTEYYMPMRLFGAGVRLMLVRAAAKRFGVDPAECEARQHRVWHKRTNRSLDYGNLLLLLEAKKLAGHPPSLDELEAALKPSSEWRFIGQHTMPFVDAHDMVTGKAVYGADVDLPGMLTASIERCPVANGQLVDFDATAALTVPGVRRVLPVLPLPPALGGGVGTAFLPHAGVAVLAENNWAAIQGRRALKPRIQWALGPNAAYESQKYRRQLEASTAEPGKKLRSKGDVDAAFARARKVVEARYYVPHLAQAPMEPPVAVALFANERWEIWAPTQAPDITQQWVGRFVLGIPEADWETEGAKEKIREKVTLHVTLLGGSFGRKSYPDFVVEAVILATQNPGVPIRVQWTREDDIKFSYFNAVSHQFLKAGLDGDGHTTAWLQRSAFPSLFATLFPPSPPFPKIYRQARAAFHNGGEYPFGSAIERAQGLEDMPFEVENLRIENCKAESYIRIGCMRSEANIYHAFATGSFADELAVAAGRDSKDYLLELIGKGRVLDLKAEGVESFDNNGFPVEPLLVPKPSGQLVPIQPGYPPDTRRLRAVVERVAKESRWDEKVKQYKQMPNGHGLGIAAHRCFLSYVAVVIDVSLNDRNELTIHEIHSAIDCGTAVNPDRVRAQMEGGIIFGLSLALHGEITVKDGAVEQNNFDDYPVLRIYQTPRNISVSIMPSTEPPTGVGEPPVPPVAPALANAIVAAGGPRIRDLPIWKALEIL
ncbi:MAG TPA: molybdopterin cofactor-binding domain-containing protein [Isosphaeraceae bacterium]|jgi:isoquinoline 1-oxidoreductase beta subunit|nr:molybdopterin cofactor-binding domain-containing protein [Isosphaeraceae bacterium]